MPQLLLVRCVQNLRRVRQGLYWLRRPPLVAPCLNGMRWLASVVKFCGICVYPVATVYFQLAFLSCLVVWSDRVRPSPFFVLRAVFVYDAIRFSMIHQTVFSLGSTLPFAIGQVQVWSGTVR